MLITKEVEYAVRIVCELDGVEAPLSSKGLAERRSIPYPFIYRILKRLEASGILEIKKGPRGGYTLKKSCEELTLIDIIDSFENVFYLNECMKPGNKCPRNTDEQPCKVHKRLTELQNQLRGELASKPLKELFD